MSDIRIFTQTVLAFHSATLEAPEEFFSFHPGTLGVPGWSIYDSDTLRSTRMVYILPGYLEKYPDGLYITWI
jgi:hypothetical protein